MRISRSPTWPHLLLAASAVAAANVAHASVESLEAEHTLSAAAGVASPSAIGALYENPAGLVYNTRTKLVATLFTPTSSFDPLGFGGTAYFGNGFTGGAIGITSEGNYGNYGPDGSSQSVNFGVGARVTDWDLAFGVAGAYRINGGDFGDNLGLDLGVLGNPDGQFHYGANVYLTPNTVNAFGVGIGAVLSPGAVISMDAYADTGFHGKTIKPGIAINLDQVQLSVGYGIKADDYASVQIPRYTSVGVGVKLTDALSLQGYYNQIQKYWFALVYRP